MSGNLYLLLSFVKHGALLLACTESLISIALFSFIIEIEPLQFLNVIFHSIMCSWIRLRFV